MSQTARQVYLLVRSNSLAQTMSRYLIRRIEESPNIELLTNTEVISLAGNDHLETVEWRNQKTGETKKKAVTRLFSMVGAVPNSAWLKGCVTCDELGFIKTTICIAIHRFFVYLQIFYFYDSFDTLLSGMGKICAPRA